jgi:hypothetical protein
MATKRDPPEEKKTPPQPFVVRKDAPSVVAQPTAPLSTPGALPSPEEMKRIVSGSDGASDDHDPWEHGSFPVSPSFQLQLRADGFPETPPEEFYDTLPPNRKLGAVPSAPARDKPVASANDEKQKRDPFVSTEPSETKRTGSFKATPDQYATTVLSRDFLDKLKPERQSEVTADASGTASEAAPNSSTPKTDESVDSVYGITRPSMRVLELRRKRRMVGAAVLGALGLAMVFAVLRAGRGEDVAKDGTVEAVQNEPAPTAKPQAIAASTAAPESAAPPVTGAAEPSAVPEDSKLLQPEDRRTRNTPRPRAPSAPLTFKPPLMREPAPEVSHTSAVKVQSSAPAPTVSSTGKSWIRER